MQQETVSGSGISWAICKYAPRPRHITTPESHHSVFYRHALRATQPTAQSAEGKSAVCDVDLVLKFTCLSADLSLFTVLYELIMPTMRGIGELTASLMHKSLSLSSFCLSWVSSDSFLAFSASQTSCCRFLDDSDMSPLTSYTTVSKVK